VIVHRVTCRSCEGTGNALRACRCGTGYGSRLLAHPDECVCGDVACEDCNGRGTVPCEELVCEACEEIEATAKGLERVAQGGERG
jgi:RecJ-like exonuclease